MYNFSPVSDFVCIDIETTGLNPKVDKIIEIGAVRVREGLPEDSIDILVNPGMHVSDRIQQLTGIGEEMLSDAPYIKEVIPKICEFVGDDILLGHNVLFDYSFLKRAAVNEGLPFDKKGIDTLKIARKYCLGSESKSLVALCRRYGIIHNAHRAVWDVYATIELYEHLVHDFYNDLAREDFGPKDLIYKVKKESPITKQQKERLLQMLERYQTICPMEIDCMTRNEASRYMDQLVLKFGR